MKYYVLLFILVAIVYSCDEESSIKPSPSTGQPQWYYYSNRIQKDEHTIHWQIKKVDLNSGRKELVVDSARIFCQPQNGRIIYLKTYYRDSKDSGRVMDNFIFMAGQDGSNPVQLRSWNTHGSVIFAPGGKIAAFKTYYGLYLLDIEKGSFNEEMISVKDDITDFSFSPDGSRLAFVHSDRLVYIYDISTATAKKVYYGSGIKRIVSKGLCWNENYNELIFSISEDSVYFLVAVNLITGEDRIILEGKRVIFPQVINNGEKLLWQDWNNTHEGNRIWKCNMDGYYLEEVKIKSDYSYSYPQYEPFINESEIVGYLNSEQVFVLVRINIETGDVDVVSDNLYSID